MRNNLHKKEKITQCFKMEEEDEDDEIRLASCIQFSMMSPEEIKALSVVNITDSHEFGRNTVSDPRLGPMDSFFECETCSKLYKDCQGHFGSIELAEPVIHPHPKIQAIILKILRCICYNSECHRCLISRGTAELLDIMTTSRFSRLTKLTSKCVLLAMCEHCKTERFNVVYESMKYIIYSSGKKGVKKEVLTPTNIFNIFKSIPSEDLKIMGFNCELPKNPMYKNEKTYPCAGLTHRHQFRPEWMVLTVLPVLPPCVRPPSIVQGTPYQDDITGILIQIVKHNEKLLVHKKINTAVHSRGRKKQGHLKPMEKEKAYNNLVACIYSLAGVPHPKNTGKTPFRGKNPRGIQQRINKKGGMIRKHVMAKRTDQSGRSVIGPDASLKMNQIGLPSQMAQTFTKPVFVRPYNFEACQRLLSEGKIKEVSINGVCRNLIIPYSGGKRRPFELTWELMENNEVVLERCLKDGDVVIFNRQPTLHKPSMLGFKIKILKDGGKSIRMALSVCTGFNSDFDGDEMNVHVIRNLLGEAEVRSFMMADQNIMLPQTNAPIAGHVQDALVGSYLMTGPSVFVAWETFFDCVVGANISFSELDLFYGRIREFYPDLFEEPGKRPNISNCLCPGKVLYSLAFPGDFFYSLKNDGDPNEPEVQVRNGVLICGRLDKKTVGIKPNSIIHKLVIEYGHKITRKFINRSNTIINRFLTSFGFSIGLEDCVCKDRIAITTSLSKASVQCESILESNEYNERVENQIRTILNSATNIGQKIANENVNKGLDNSFNVCVRSGAKGNFINISQVMGLVGQTVISGKRAPQSLSCGKRSLPHFKCDDRSPSARGFISHSYLAGISCIESFFHSMAGREGIIDTSCKTSESGYLQRKIGKKLEDLVIYGDGTVRNMNGNIVQFIYGEDGFNPCELCYISSEKDPFFVDVFRLSEKINSYSTSRIFEPLTTSQILQISSSLVLFSNHTIVVCQALKNIQRRLIGHLKKIFLDLKFFEILKEEILRRWYKSITPCGEAVGLIATTSIGQPTTQSTLNVFHHAGVAEKDVTLGVPRINEILVASKNPKTPSCMVYISDENNEKIAIKTAIRNTKSDEEKKRETCKLVDFVRQKGQFEILRCKDLLQAPPEQMYVLSKNKKIPEISPVAKAILTYNEFRSEDYWWWDEEEPEQWVIKLEFDPEKLYSYRLSLSHISSLLEKRPMKLPIKCVFSPQAQGEIFVMLANNLNKDIISFLPPNDLLNVKNMLYYIYRDLLIPGLLETYIQGIKNISKTFIRYDEKEEDWIIDTQGSNLADVLAHKHVDKIRTMSDNMWEIYNVLGIEATRNFLIDEFLRVLCFDGGYVNIRHVQLLIDEMTRKGTITSCDRHGIDRSAGPLAKACFEQSLDNLCLSSVYGESDKNRSMSSRVAFGCPVLDGTSMVRLISNEKE